MGVMGGPQQPADNYADEADKEKAALGNTRRVEKTMRRYCVGEQELWNKSGAG